MSLSPLFGDNGMPMFANGLPTLTEDACACCTEAAFQSCFDVVSCLYQRKLLLTTSWDNRTGEGCYLSELSNVTLDFGQPSGPTRTIDCFLFDRGFASLPPAIWQWRNARHSDEINDLASFDCDGDGDWRRNLFHNNAVDHVMAGIQCVEEGIIAYLSYHFMGCSYGCGCGFVTPLISDPVPWEDVAAALEGAAVSFELHRNEADATAVHLLTEGSGGTARFIGSPKCNAPCSTLCEGEPPSIVQFEICKSTACFYTLTYELAEGSCPIAFVWLEVEEGEIIILPTAPVEDDWPNTILVNLTSECGGHGGDVKLWVIDDCGCCATATKTYSCCRCNDSQGFSCGTGCGCETLGSGGATALQTGPCTYQICASYGGCPQGGVLVSVSGGGCPQDAAEDCPCDFTGCEEDPETGDWSNCFRCVRFLGDGECFNVTITSSGELRYKVTDGVCGCEGPLSEPEILPCTACEACDDFDGINMTISNTGDCADTTGCDQFNGCWNVPVVSSSEDECFGELTVPGTVVNDPAGSLPAELYLWWRIYKSGSDWLLDYGWSITVGDPGLVISGDNLGVLLSPDPLLCQAISDDFTETSASCFFCIENGVNCAIASGSC